MAEISQVLDALTPVWRHTTAQLVASTIEKHAALIQSPIEREFLMWWVAAKATGINCDVDIEPQYEVSIGEARYRLDFRVFLAWPGVLKFAAQHGIEFPKIAVELDGHEWHERTPEQVEYRNQRDRDLQRAGWKVFHFSGREVMRDGFGCLKEVFNFAQRSTEEFMCAVKKVNQGLDF
ncbi:MAG: DUF559 domain-containing protein [Candidatus Methylomirabilales bacterium]